MQIESLCNSCKYRDLNCPGVATIVFNCTQYETRKPRTCGDRVRAMTDEELANFLCDNTNCGHCIAAELCWNGHNGFDYWLKQEAKE